MPKKTKKQKISAELRRKIFLINQIKKLQNHENQQKKAPSYDTDQQGITTKVNINTWFNLALVTWKAARI